MDMLKAQFAKPGVHAGVGAFMMSQQYPRARFAIAPGTPLIGGKVYSPAIVGAAVGFASSFIVEALNNILTTTDKKNRLKSFPSFITHVGGSAASWILLPRLVAGLEGQDMVKLATSGILSEVIAQWVYENFVEDGSFGQDVLDLI
jgi:hypothetical protein